LLEQFGWLRLSGRFWGSLLLVVGGLSFVSLWLSHTAQWWPLIPGGILLGWGAATLLHMVGVAEWLVLALGFTCSALPFFYIFFKLGPRETWWALIPASTLAGWGLGSVLQQFGLPHALFLVSGFLGTAVPFLYVFFLERERNWWALIPGGVLVFVGLAMAGGTLLGEAWVASLILWGIALVFAAVFVADLRQWWALIPAGVLAVVGLGVSPLGPALQYIGPLLIIVVGVALLLRGFRR